MTNLEKWNLIVEQVRNKLTSKEKEIQQLWEDFFADASLFGYSKLKGEIDSQRSLHIGASDRAIPDIIIRDMVSKKDLFIVELKQSNLPPKHIFREQLFSYMRLLRISIGILICDKIYMYFWDLDNKEESIEISFTENNELGVKFIELLGKGHFDETNIENFIKGYYLFQKHVDEIKQDVQTLPVKDVIADYYSMQYSSVEITEALKRVEVKISFETPITDLPTKPNPNPPRPSVGNDGDDIFKDLTEKYVIIKTTDERVNACNGSMYEATRYAWRADLNKIQQYCLVFGVIKGIVRGVYFVTNWYAVNDTTPGKRCAFNGSEAPEEFAKKYLWKQIPERFRRKGMASPLLYGN